MLDIMYSMVVILQWSGAGSGRVDRQPADLSLLSRLRAPAGRLPCSLPTSHPSCQRSKGRDPLAPILIVAEHLRPMTTVQLDQHQQAFCLAPPQSNLRLLAPAGCGKTLCLLARCQQLAEHAARRNTTVRFLLVTFTRAARDELATRLHADSAFVTLRALHQRQHSAVDICTLNSWGFRRIRQATFSPTLLTTSKSLHFAVMNQLQPVWRRHETIAEAIAQNRHRAPRRLMNVIDAFKSLGFDHTLHANFETFSRYIDKLAEQHLDWRLAEQFHELASLDVLGTKYKKGGQESPRTGKRELYTAFFRFWREAVEQLIASATFTFEDQKYVAYLDERKKADDGAFLSGAAGYSHILVDEFQDINPLDLALVRAIADRNRATITIAGDDDQAIFEWRGASPEYILEPGSYLERRFRTHTLSVNYRSPENIVRRSQRLIANNQRRVEKSVRASGNHKAQIDIMATEDLTSGLDRVCDIVRSATAESHRVAIIGRKRSQIIPYQVLFASLDIPFCAAEDLQIFLSDTFDRLIEMLEVKTRLDFPSGPLQASRDLVALCDYVKRYPISKKDRNTLGQHIRRARPKTLMDAIEALVQYEGRLKGPNKDGKVSLSMVDALLSFLTASTVSDTLSTLGEKFDGLRTDFGKAEDDIFFLDPPFLFLSGYAARHGDDYSGFVAEIERAREQLVLLPQFEAASDSDRSELWNRPVHLMTAQRAKGKEFDIVVLLDVVDGIWPIRRKDQTEQELEAERRIFYVAFTRTRKRIVIQVPGGLGSKPTVSSPYVEELGLTH